MEIKNNNIPVVFAVDDNYVPLLAVAINSILKNSSKDYYYSFYILINQLKDENKKLLQIFNTDNSSVTFLNVSNELDKISSRICLRDYYSNATYFRMFVPDLLKQFNKAIYLDCDMVVVDDLSKLYNIDIGNNIVGAVTDDIVQVIPEFIDYVENGLGVPSNKYFNAGLLVMNLEKMREVSFVDKFINSVKNYQFKVAQDQDHLNVICYGDVCFIDNGWNKTPLQDDFKKEDLKLIHFKMAMRPWLNDNIPYEEYFWKCTSEIALTEYFKAWKKRITEEDRKKSAEVFSNLRKMCTEYAEDENNYYCVIRKHKN